MHYVDLINALYNSTKKAEAKYVIFDITDTALEMLYVRGNTKNEWQTLLGISSETWEKLIKRTKAELKEDGRYKTTYPNIKRAYIESEARDFVENFRELRRRQKGEINQTLKEIYGKSKEEQMHRVGDRRNYTCYRDNTIKGVEFWRLLAELYNKIKTLSEEDTQAYLSEIKRWI